MSVFKKVRLQKIHTKHQQTKTATTVKHSGGDDLHLLFYSGVRFVGSTVGFSLNWMKLDSGQPSSFSATP